MNKPYRGLEYALGLDLAPGVDKDYRLVKRPRLELADLVVYMEGEMAYLQQIRVGRGQAAAGLLSAPVELRALYRTIEVSPNAVAIADAEANIEYVNQRFSQLTGYSFEEVVGKPVTGLASREREGEDSDRLRAAILSGGEWRGECQGTRKDGRPYWSSRTVSVVRDDGGVITHFVVVDEETTGRKLWESRLLQVQKLEAVGLLAAGAVHDFNNLLLAVLGFTALLQRRLEPASEGYEHAKTIETLAQRGADLTRRLLAMSREDPVEARPVNLNAAVLEALKLLEPALPMDVRIVAKLQEDLPSINGDHSRLEQVIMNLCLNAADAMPGGGSLGLSTGAVGLEQEINECDPALRSGRYVRLCVTDTGAGIDDALKPRIFEPFFTTKAEGKGTGLGLFVVHSIVKEHGGAVQVSSELGHGSSFTVFLPVCDPHQD